MSIEEADPIEEQPWYHDIKTFLESSSHLPGTSAADRRTLAHLASKYVLGAGQLYRRSYNQMLLLCLSKAEADTLMLQVHAGTCGPHMNGVLLAKKIILQGYFWSTMEADCCQFMCRCHNCQIHGNLMHAPPQQLHSMSLPWPFSTWGIDVIGAIYPAASNGHRFILVVIDYFTKWVEAASYKAVTAVAMEKFIRNNIVARYGVPHSIISDNGTNFIAKRTTEYLQSL